MTSPALHHSGAFGAAYDKLTELCRAAPYVTSDDLQDALDGQLSPSQVGRVFQHAVETRIIERTPETVQSRRKARRGGRIQVWRSNPFLPRSPDVALTMYVASYNQAETAQGRLV